MESGAERKGEMRLDEVCVMAERETERRQLSSLMSGQASLSGSACEDANSGRLWVKSAVVARI